MSVPRSMSAREQSCNTSTLAVHHRTKLGSRQDLDENKRDDRTGTDTPHIPVSEIRGAFTPNDSTPRNDLSGAHWDVSESRPLDYTSNNSSINPTYYAYEEPEILTDSAWTQGQAHPHTWPGTFVDNHPSTKYQNNTTQLHQWAYETSDANLTIAERFEKRNWETERHEKL